MRQDDTAAAGPGAGSAGAAAAPAPAANPDSAGKQQCGGAALPAATAAAPAPDAAAQLQQGSQQAQWGAERKRPASQEADPRYGQKRSRFGRESQEQQEQEEEQRRRQQAPPQREQQQRQLEGPRQQPEEQPQRRQLGQATGARNAWAAAAAGTAEHPGSLPLLTQGEEGEGQEGRQPLDGSEPCSSSGIICTQQPPSSGAAGEALPPLSAPPGPDPAGHAPAAGVPLAALHQLWQQQGVASPLAALLGTPGGLSAPPASCQRREDAAAGGAGSPWPAGPPWQSVPVAGAAEGATPRFVGPTGTGGSSGTPWQPAAAAQAGAPALGWSPLHALLGLPAPPALPADGAEHPCPAPAAQRACWQQQEPQQAQQPQHHRLARSSSPQFGAAAGVAAGAKPAVEEQLPVGD